MPDKIQKVIVYKTTNGQLCYSEEEAINVQQWVDGQEAMKEQAERTKRLIQEAILNKLKFKKIDSDLIIDINFMDSYLTDHMSAYVFTWSDECDLSMLNANIIINLNDNDNSFIGDLDHEDLTNNVTYLLIQYYYVGGDNDDDSKYSYLVTIDDYEKEVAKFVEERMKGFITKISEDD